MVTPNLYKSIEQLSEERYGIHNMNLRSAQAPHLFASKASREKSDKIYAMYAQGLSQTEIARRLGCSKQAVNLRIQQFKALGLAYKTEKEKLKEERNRVFRDFELNKIERYRLFHDRWMEMLEKNEQWHGTPNEFLEEMQRTYGINRQTVKNNIALAKRIRNLRETFYIGEQYEFLTLQELFEVVYQDYTELRKSNPEKTIEQLCMILSAKYSYARTMLYNIITGMENHSIDWDGKLKVKIPMAQTLNRDRSVFIDCLKWTGTRAEFLKYASQKYHVSTRTINEIILLNCMADPKRYEISKLN